MSQPEATPAGAKHALEEVAKHELLYAERKSLQAGDLLAVLKSVRRRQGIMLTGLAGWLVAEVLLVILQTESAITAADLGAPLSLWPRVFVLLIGVLVARQTVISYRRCGAAIREYEAGSDAHGASA